LIVRIDPRHEDPVHDDVGPGHLLHHLGGPVPVGGVGDRTGQFQEAVPEAPDPQLQVGEGGVGGDSVEGPGGEVLRVVLAVRVGPAQAGHGPSDAVPVHGTEEIASDQAAGDARSEREGGQNQPAREALFDVTVVSLAQKSSCGTTLGVQVRLLDLNNVHALDLNQRMTSSRPRPGRSGDRPVTRRVVFNTLLLAGVLATALVLFFLLAGRVQPLVGP